MGDTSVVQGVCEGIRWMMVPVFVANAGTMFQAISPSPIICQVWPDIYLAFQIMNIDQTVHVLVHP
jgi:hypothetical protein